MAGGGTAPRAAVERREADASRPAAAASAPPDEATPTRPPSTSQPARAERAPALTGTPEPFAPGYDDVKTWDDPAPGPLPRPGSDAASPVRITVEPASTASSEQRVRIETAPGASCWGGGALAGMVPVRGEFALSLGPGRHAAEVHCVGPGGVTVARRTLAVPWPVLPTSWQNRAAAGGVPWPAAEGAPWAAADFLRDGELAVFSALPEPTTGAMRAAFFTLDERGAWIERTRELIGEAADLRLCERPVQALVGDLNGDGRPDVYVVCAAERHVAYVSQPGSGYRRVDTGVAGWSSTAEVADVDGDARVDVFTLDAAGQRVVALGRGDGTFDYRPR